MIIKILESQDYKRYRTTAIYQDGKWTGDAGSISIANEITQDHNLDLEKEKDARKFEILLSGSRTWAKIIKD